MVNHALGTTRKRVSKLSVLFGSAELMIRWLKYTAMAAAAGSVVISVLLMSIGAKLLG